MRTNYFFKSAVMVTALVSVTTVFAQTGPKTVNFTELPTPVTGEKAFQETSSAAAAWGDYNNDGYLDLLVTGAYWKAIEVDEVTGDTIRNIDESGNALLPYYPRGENEPTRIQGNWIRSTKLYKNNGNGTFDVVEHAFPHLDQGGIAWLDYNNDGNLDVFIAGADQNGNLYSGLWENSGAAGGYTFTDAFPADFEYFRLGGYTNSSRVVAAADYNNDGWVDIAVQGWSGSDRITYLYKNNAGIYFSKVENPVDGDKEFIGMTGGSLTWGDYDNDGYLDLLAYGYLSINGDIRASSWDLTTFYDLRPGCDDGTCISGAGILYVNNGDGTFKTPTANNITFDRDGEGRITAVHLTAGTIFPYGEDGDASFADYNNDGWLDIYGTGYAWWEGIGWSIGVYENTQDGSYTRHNQDDLGLVGTQSDYHSWGDVNNDGQIDVAVTRTYPTSAVFLNTGNSSFERFNLGFGENKDQLEVRAGAITLVDFDNDNDLDLYINGRLWSERCEDCDNYGDVDDQARLFRNELDVLEGIPTNAAPSKPTNLQATPTADADGVTFSWNVASDDLTPALALVYNLYVKQGDLIYSVLPADLTTGRLKVNESLAPIAATTYTFFGLEGEYEWGVQAIDNAKNASAFEKVGGSSIAAVNLNSVRIHTAAKSVEVKAEAGLTGTVSVYNVQGAQVYDKAGEINGTTIALPVGIYLVKVVSAEGIATSKAIVK